MSINTNNLINNINNYSNNNVYNKNSSQDTGSLFASLLKMNMNNQLASIGNFDNLGSSANSSNSFGSNGMNGLGGMSGMSGLGNMSGMGNFQGQNGLSDVFGMGNGLSGLSLSSGMYGKNILGDLLGGGGMGGGASNPLASLTGGMDMMSFIGMLVNSKMYKNYSYNNNNNVVNKNKAANVYQQSTGKLVTPTNASKETSGGIIGNENNRSAALYNTIINQFDVENNGRYKPRSGNTYCNIYVWDVSRAMGAPVPHHTDSNGNIVSSTTPGARAMTANSMRNWMAGSAGQKNGWKKVSAEQAQNYANQGRPSVVVNHNSSGGHISMVAPSTDGKYNAQKGVMISQAGSNLINKDYITKVYSANRMKNVEYFVHA